MPRSRPDTSGGAILARVSDVTAPPREDLYVPDRFEGLRDVGRGALRSIIVPVADALSSELTAFTELQAAEEQLAAREAWLKWTERDY
jgi:hypothetical protein